jgi:hypothetical protein
MNEILTSVSHGVLFRDFLQKLDAIQQEVEMVKWQSDKPSRRFLKEE